MEDKVLEIMDAEEEKKRLAVQALNMCTVSVSQIIDYNDLYVLEQEYDAILNNLNLENMPKDEPLLKVLTQILDTITFFRIQDIRKEQIEREYQNRLKDAVWSAVPSLSVFVSGNPAVIALSLATTVGTGYMNYRREKVQAGREKEKAEIELQITAIEQFNALKRELFTTAWRLSDKYNYNDRLRLNERQIRQYNEILMDPDDGRRLKRLESIKEAYDAYPPFWYYLGNCASLLMKQYEQKDDKENATQNNVNDYARQIYRNKAIEYYKKFRTFNSKALLREDPITSACCLEYAELLDVQKDKNTISELIADALRFSGNRFDIWELCAFEYLRIEEHEKARNIFLRLFNEEYNKIFNAQILSEHYVGEYILLSKRIQDKDSTSEDSMKDEQVKEGINKIEDLLVNYTYLKNRIDDRYLFPMPDGEIEDFDILEYKFQSAKKLMVAASYYEAMKSYFERCSVRFNKILPVWQGQQTIPEYYYEDSSVSRSLRLSAAKLAFSNEKNKTQFLQDLYDVDILIEYLRLFDDMAVALNSLACIRDMKGHADTIKNQFLIVKNNIENCLIKIPDGSFDYKCYEQLSSYSLLSFTKTFIEQLFEEVFDYISKLPITVSGKEFTLNEAEADLRNFCREQNIEDPEIILNSVNTPKEEEKYFFMDSLAGSAHEAVKAEKEHIKKLLDDVINCKDKLFNSQKKYHTNLILRSDVEFKPYISSIKRSGNLYETAIAVLDDKSPFNQDLLLTKDGVYAIVNMNIRGFISYKDIPDEKINEGKIHIPGINETKFMKDIPDALALSHGVAIFMTGIVPGAISIGAVKAAQAIARNIYKDFYENKDINIPELYALCKKLGNYENTEKVRNLNTEIVLDGFLEDLWKRQKGQFALSMRKEVYAKQIQEESYSPKEEYYSEETNSSEPVVLAESYDDSSLAGVARREGITLNNRYNFWIYGEKDPDSTMIKKVREATGLSMHDSKIMASHNSTIAVFLPYEDATRIQGIIGTSLSYYLIPVESKNVKMTPVIGELISQKIIKEHIIELKADMISKDLQVQDPVVLETSQKNLIGGITTKAGGNSCKIYCVENVSGEILKVWKMVN